MEPTIFIVLGAVVLIVVLAYMITRLRGIPVRPLIDTEADRAALPPEVAKPYSNPSGFEDNLADALEKEYRWEQMNREDDPTWYRKGVEGFEFRKAVEAALKKQESAAQPPEDDPPAE